MLGIVIPMVTLLVTHVLMYITLRKQAVRMSQSTTQDQTQRLREITKTFIVVVAAFYVCVFPHSFWHTYESYLVMSNMNDRQKIRTKAMHAHDTFTIMMYLSCCLNPFIYSKLHLRIFAACKWLHSKIKELFPAVRKTRNLRHGNQQWPLESFRSLAGVKAAINCDDDVRLRNLNSDGSQKRCGDGKVDSENTVGNVNAECGKVNATFKRYEILN